MAAQPKLVSFLHQHDAGPSDTAPTTTVGIISDTHGVLDDAIVGLFRSRGVSHIVHGGDIGPGRNKGKSRLSAAQVLARLEAVAPVYAIAGNVDEEGGGAGGGKAALGALDGPRLRVSTAAVMEFEVAELRFWLSHGHHFPIKPATSTSGGGGDGASLLTFSGITSNAEAQARITAAAPDIVVCGHTHKPILGRLEGVRGGDGCRTAGPVFVNPGSAGPQRFSLPRSFAILSVWGGDSGGKQEVTVDRFEYRKGEGNWQAVESKRFEM